MKPSPAPDDPIGIVRGSRASPFRQCDVTPYTTAADQLTLSEQAIYCVLSGSRSPSSLFPLAVTGP
jgi:hypothetical protein